MAAHPFAEKLFPAVTIFRHGGVGIAFLQRYDIRLDLFVGCIDARRRSIKEPLDAELARRHEQMRID